MFDGFWFGVVVGVIAGGFFINVDLRTPDWLKDFVSGLKSKAAKAAK